MTHDEATCYIGKRVVVVYSIDGVRRESIYGVVVEVHTFGIALHMDNDKSGIVLFDWLRSIAPYGVTPDQFYEGLGMI